MLTAGVIAVSLTVLLLGMMCVYFTSQDDRLRAENAALKRHRAAADRTADELAAKLEAAKTENARLRNIICQIKSDVDARVSTIGKEAK